MRDKERTELGRIHDQLAQDLHLLAIFLDNTPKGQPYYDEAVKAFRSIVRMKPQIRELCKEGK